MRMRSKGWRVGPNYKNEKARRRAGLSVSIVLNKS